MSPTEKIYLLSGNGSTRKWWEDCLPFFEKREPVPLELPGFGDNPSDQYHNFAELADALVEMTEPGKEIFVVGINGLVVLHALVRHPEHFSRVYLLAPVGAFLWKRWFARVMALPIFHHPIHFLLSRFPKLFRRKFSSRTWTEAQYARMGEGYRKCRAFTHYFSFTKPADALDHFAWIKTPIELIWGHGDAVLGVQQAAAWDSILPRAELGITLKEDWEHYPYIDDPKGFAEFLESNPRGFPAHSKAGRLQLATLAGLPVPKAFTVTPATDLPALVSGLDTQKTYAIRSSGANEDKIDHSNAGVNDSYLDVPVSEVPEKVKLQFSAGMEETVVQEFIRPKVSGVAFVRNIGMEIELVEGHLENYISGRTSPHRFTWSKMGGEWEEKPDFPAQSKILASGFSANKLVAFLHKCIAAFHYAHSDIEWAWDGQQFLLLQLRPVTSYAWQRALTSANLDEILPKQVSRLMEHGQRRASLYIPTVYAHWDARILEDAEPFTVTAEDASYINSDVFLSRFHDWGLPGNLYAKEIGGAVPKIPFRPLRFLATVPRFLKMQSVCRKELSRTGQKLSVLKEEFERIAQLEKEKREDAYVNWFVRYYTFIVRQNMLINAAISSAFGAWFKPPPTVYQDMENAIHRLKYESDPATPRPDAQAPAISDFPHWPGWVRLLHKIGFPGLRGYYTQVREWFRDSNMKLFYALNKVLQGSEWLEMYPAARKISGSFWENGKSEVKQDFSLLIYPGKVEGIAGKEILIVDALEPGHFTEYQQALGVVSRSGGKLSHGSTLLRELKKPSAIIPDASADWMGKKVRLENGKLSLLE